MIDTLYITGAGVSAQSGIPTFRGEDGYWTVGSRNYTPMEMATRKMYETQPLEFLTWYYHRFATYRHHGPNSVHKWLVGKPLITQNIDGLDAKAGHTDYISVHGRLDLMTLYHRQGVPVDIIPAPWDAIDETHLEDSLLDIFRISKQSKRPELNVSFKPYVLLFDEFYTDLYKISQAQEMMYQCQRMVFIGTSFSVNVTQMALNAAMVNNIPVEIVDPDPVKIPYHKVTYHRMQASEYITQA